MAPKVRTIRLAARPPEVSEPWVGIWRGSQPVILLVVLVPRLSQAATRHRAAAVYHAYTAAVSLASPMRRSTVRTETPARSATSAFGRPGSRRTMSRTLSLPVGFRRRPGVPGDRFLSRVFAVVAVVTLPVRTAAAADAAACRDMARARTGRPFQPIRPMRQRATPTRQRRQRLTGIRTVPRRATAR
jgi:hypothetical protein